MDVYFDLHQWKIKFVFPLISFLMLTNTFAAHHIVNLTVGYKTVYFAGKPRKAIVVNNQIPAPTLHFKEGDRVTIHVFNRLDKETALHWHGMLVPWQMDGVLGISQQGIPPGGVFHYQFTLHQSGTYWYHAHAGLQEQQGLYGAFLIDPLKKPSYHYSKDYVVVLSDWSNTYPEQIFANLKKDGDYYSPNFPLQPSLRKFINDYRKANTLERKKVINDYMMMQQMRMGIYDMSDVAYDAFLLNGYSKKNPWTVLVKVGDWVRLRFIGAGGETIFHVKIPNTTMQVIHVQGNDVIPYVVNDFTVAPGETYDVLVHITNTNPRVIYAESEDKVGMAYGVLLTSQSPPVNLKNITPFPEPLPTTRKMMSSQNMMHDDMNQNDSSMNSMMNHTMSIPSEMKEKTFGTKYQTLRAAIKTNDPSKPIDDTIRMDLNGWMGSFIWFINGVPEYKAKPILLEPSKRYRLIFTNNSMMNHPMHIHGHWFILRNGHGAYDPLLHTIDVPPGSTVVVDLDTDASGQWFFHCHMLYHMLAGMARVFQYSTLIEITQGEKKPEHLVKDTIYPNRPIVRVDETRPIDTLLVHHPMAHPPGFYFSSYLDVGADPFSNTEKITFKGLYGPDYHKLELFTNDAEIKKGKIENADMDIFYWNLTRQFWAIKGGVNYFYRPAAKPYWQPGVGIEGLMPWFIDTDIRGYYYGGSAKLDVELTRDTQITNNFFINLGVRSILASKTVTQAAIGGGLNQMQYTIRPYYRLRPGLNIFAQYEYDQDYGSFKNIERNLGSSATESILTVGLTILF